MTHKVLVTFDDTTWKIIAKNITGLSESDGVRGMVLKYLEDKGYILKPKLSDEITKEFATHEIMIGALVHALSDKGVITVEDWEKRVNAQVQ